VFMEFGQMKPDADRHQSPGDQQWLGDRFAHCQGQHRAEEGATEK
jgi:hypothetical protein